MVASGRIAIIPARGGSKRLPGKNILDFQGKPMIAWTIEAAHSSDCFDHVVVSTDSKEIAEISIAFGASVPWLRDQHSDDHSNVSEVLAHELPRLQRHYASAFHTVAMLMANCPLRTSLHIQQHVERFQKTEAEFQLSAFPYTWAKPWWAHEVGKEQGVATPLFPEELKARSQDLPELLCPTGAIWLARVGPFLEARTFYGPDYRFFELDPVAATDIDDETDLHFAKALATTSSFESSPPDPSV